MHPQVVQDQEQLARLPLDQAAQEVDQDLGIQGAGEDLPTHLPLVGDRADDRQAVPLVVDALYRGLTLGSVAAAAHVVAAQSALVAPVNLGPFGPGACGNRRVLRLQPVAHRRRRLLVGFLHRLLWRETPALQIQPHRAHRQHHAEALLDQLRHRGAAPQRVRHLQLIGGFVGNQAACRHLPVSSVSCCAGWIDRCSSRRRTGTAADPSP